VQNAYYLHLHAIVERAIKDHVTPVGNAAQPFSQFAAGAAKKGPGCESVTMLLKTYDKPVSVGSIITSDKAANFDQVALGVLREKKPRHVSSGREPCLEARENILSFVHPARC